MKFLSPLLFLAVIIFVVSNVMASPYPEEPLLDDNALERANKEGCIRKERDCIPNPDDEQCCEGLQCKCTFFGGFCVCMEKNIKTR
uniref:U5-Eretoxin-Ek1a_4 n=1 Tax=Eresus cinnaberinus TaxID=175337 RepID=A0A2D0PC80_ERECI